MRSKGFPVKFKRFISFISVGQYQTKLYHEGNDKQSSIFGGIVTILCGILIVLFSFYLIGNTLFGETEYDLHEYVNSIN